MDDKKIEEYLASMAHSLEAIASILSVLNSKAILGEKYIIHNHYSSTVDDFYDEVDGEIQYN